MSEPGAAFDPAMAAIERLIADLEAEPPTSTRERAKELLRAVLDVHALGLQRMLEVLRRDAGDDALRRVQQDAQLASLLSLHGLDRIGVEETLISLSRLRPASRAREQHAPEAAALLRAADAEREEL